MNHFSSVLLTPTFERNRLTPWLERSSPINPIARAIGPPDATLQPRRTWEQNKVPKMTVLHTALLGKIEGKTSDGVTEFLGIKYATLKNRFAEAQIAQPSSTDTLDATTHG